MRRHILSALLLKEAREVLRDRRTLLLTLVVPAIVYPLVIASMGQLTAAATASLRARTLVVAVHPDLPEDINTALRKAGRLQLKTTPTPEEDVRDGEARAGMIPDVADGVVLIVDQAQDESRAAAERLEMVIAKVRQERLQGRLGKLGVDERFLEPLPLKRKNTSLPERMRSYAAARMLPFLLIILSLVGASAAAVDTTAGERERGTLLTLMSTPVHSAEVAAAKLVTVACVAMAAGLCNVISLGLTLLGALPNASEMGLALSPGLVLLCILALVPTTLYGAAMLLGLAALGKTSREAQTATAPALFICIGLAGMVAIPGVQSQPMLDALPVTGPALLMRDLVMGDASWRQGLTVLCSSAVTLWLLVSFAARVLMSEPMVSSQVSTAAVIKDLSGNAQPTPLTAALIASLLLGASVYAAPVLQRGDLVMGLLGTQVVMLVLPLLVLALLKLKPMTLTGMNARPAAAAFASALLIGMSMALPLSFLEAWLVKISGMEHALEEVAEGLADLFKSDLTPLQAFLVIGVVPGICEELAFRGALTGALLRVMKPWSAIVVQAVVFGLAHQSALRFPPTFVLGMILGVLRWRSGSVWPGVLLHTMHNGLLALALTGAELGSDEEAVLEFLGNPALLAAIAASLGAGAWFAYRLKVPSDDGKT